MSRMLHEKNVFKLANKVAAGSEGWFWYTTPDHEAAAAVVRGYVDSKVLCDILSRVPRGGKKRESTQAAAAALREQGWEVDTNAAMIGAHGYRGRPARANLVATKGTQKVTLLCAGSRVGSRVLAKLALADRDGAVVLLQYRKVSIV